MMPTMTSTSSFWRPFTTTRHEGIVPFRKGTQTRHLHVRTSFLRSMGERVGIIVVLGDVSELMELRDAMQAMERIKALNHELELRNELLYKTFGRFLSERLVRQMVEAPGGPKLGGSKQRVTVLMSDLRGFTAFTSRTSPTNVIKMLNHYLSEMTEIIEKFGGTIVEFVGDGILAIFGAEERETGRQAGGAAEAVAAAIAMQGRMPEVSAWNRCHGYEELQMGIGIHTSELVVGIIGSLRRMKYGAVGYGINLAGRVESYTLGGQVLISGDTRDAVQTELGVVHEETVVPKGGEPMQICQVTSIGAPYHLSYELQQEEIKRLPTPVSVLFHCLDGKHVEREAQHGKLTGLSGTAAILETEARLQPMDNIRIDVAGQIFGKVIRREGAGWQVAFTATVPKFEEWSRHLFCV